MRIRLKHQRLLAILGTSGLSQNHWAIKLGLSRGHWSDIVNGNHPFPSAKTRTRLLEAFGLEFADLFEADVESDALVDVDFRRAISERYFIDGEVGQGGMGAVFLARDLRHGRVVALKVIASEAVSGIGLAQFRREITTLAQLHHPNILPLFEAGDVAGHPFFVMPLVREGSLRAWITANGRMSLADALPRIRGIASALTHAHGEHVLHCDVKPENVLLHGVHAWVTDFGIARRLHSEAQEWPRQPGVDLSAGTPAYVSPEQAAGEPDLDARSDVYSLGCMVYEMLSGSAPFKGLNTQQVVASRFIHAPPPLRDIVPGIPAEVDAVIAKAMSLSRERRQVSAIAFSQEMEQAARVASTVSTVARDVVLRALNGMRRASPWSLKHPTGQLMRHFVEDLRYAVRVALRNRIVTAAVIGAMVMGIAVTTAVFSLVNSVLIRPLPFEGSDRVVQVGIVNRSGKFAPNVAFPDMQDYRRESTQFTDFTATQLSGTTLNDSDTPEHLMVTYVDEAYARVFGIKPSRGRFFAADELAPSGPRVAMISDALWLRDFGRDSSIVGKMITLDGTRVTVVGVMPPTSYTYPYPGIDILQPLRPREGTFEVRRGAMWLRGAAKLKPAVTLSQAQGELTAIANGIAKAFPDANGGLGVRIGWLRDAETDSARLMLELLAAAVGAVLLIAAVNIANVLLGQSRARVREFAVRAALGGGPGRIRRQLLTESVFLAAIGGAIGIALAPLLSRALIAMYPGTLPRSLEVGMDVRVLGVALAATLLAGIIAGLPTARKATTVDLTVDLKDGGRGGSSAGQRRTGNILIATQVAISLAVVFAATLLLRSFLALSDTNPGFAAQNVTTFYVGAPTSRYTKRADVANFLDLLDRDIRALPGVVATAQSAEVPFNGNSSSDVFLYKERGDLGVNNPQVRVAAVSSQYFQTLQVPIIAGRTFAATDNATTPRIVVVNDALVKRYYPEGSPVGRHILYQGVEWEIAGVVGAMRMESMATPAAPELYTVLGQTPERGVYFFVKTASSSVDFVKRLRGVVHAVDPTISMDDVSTMDQRLSDALAPQRFRAGLVTGLGAVAFLLSVLGIYGVVAYTVSRQTREIGIRIALGEARGQVQARVVRSAVRVAVTGAMFGVVLALATSRWLASVVVGVGTRDPLTLGGATLLLLATAAAAAYVPARRASRIDPLTALRSE